MEMFPPEPSPKVVLEIKAPLLKEMLLPKILMSPPSPGTLISVLKNPLLLRLREVALISMSPPLPMEPASTSLKIPLENPLSLVPVIVTPSWTLIKTLPPS